MPLTRSWRRPVASSGAVRSTIRSGMTVTGHVGEVDQLVGDAAEQRAHAPEAARPEDDLVGVADVGDVGDRPWRPGPPISSRSHVMPLSPGCASTACFHHGLGIRERAVDERLVGAAAAPGLGDVPGVDEVELAAQG